MEELFIIESDVNGSGSVPYVFKADDVHLVIAPNVIVTTDNKNDAIDTDEDKTYNDDYVENYGMISGKNGINLHGDLNYVFNAAGASIVSEFGVALIGNAGTIANHGAIDSQVVGMDLVGAYSSVVNYGSVSGGVGIGIGSSFGSIVNYGTITGSGGLTLSPSAKTLADIAPAPPPTVAIEAFNVAIPVVNKASGLPAGYDGLSISNQGVITGDVVFGDGHNLFRGVGGSVMGDIIGGNDSNYFDLSHQTVTGLISGGFGDDTIIGTAGDDFIDGFGGTDYLDGGAGNNTLVLSDAVDGIAYDLLFPSRYSDDTIINFQNLSGSGGNDMLLGDMGDNKLTGLEGSDILYGRGGNDIVDGGAGNDLIYAGTGNSHYHGGAGSDLISFANLGFGVTISLALQASSTQALGASTIAIDGFEALSGTPFADTLTGDGNANTISGGAGDDHINGGLGNDTILGGAGNDTLVGGGGTDTVSYSDAIAGVTVSLAKTVQQNTIGAGLDTISGFVNLTGSNHDDTLTGTTGANTFSGLAGKDTITGGGGHDTFAISAAPSAANLTTVTDFSATDDVFALNRAAFKALPAGSTLAVNAFFIGNTAHASTDRIIYNSTTGDISYDADGSGAGHAIIFAHVSPNLALNTGDFHIYG